MASPEVVAQLDSFEFGDFDPLQGLSAGELNLSDLGDFCFSFGDGAESSDDATTGKRKAAGDGADSSDDATTEKPEVAGDDAITKKRKVAHVAVGEGGVESGVEGGVESGVEGDVESDVESDVGGSVEGSVESDVDGSVEGDVESDVESDVEGSVDAGSDDESEDDGDEPAVMFDELDGQYFNSDLDSECYAVDSSGEAI